MSRWMLYGAYGYTGRLIVSEAVERGHRPVLAGRNRKKLATLAGRYGLEYMKLGLKDPASLAAAVADFELVFHAAGPYAFTGEPMLRACLDAGAHYLDITGEIEVLEKIFSAGPKASERGVALMPGAGFDVVPTDCLALYVAEQQPSAVKLEIAFSSSGSPSAGTAKSMLESLPKGGWLRREGRYTPYPLGRGAKRVCFSDGRERTTLPIPWGDLATAWRSTGIPNITTYMAFPTRFLGGTRRLAPAGQKALSIKPIRRLAQKTAEWLVKGPDKRARRTGRSLIWARAADEAGNGVEAWMETMESYQFTAVAGVRCLEKVLEQGLAGAFTPAQAFGSDFVLEIEGTKRYDDLG